jgi:hypothetical protein
MILGDRVRHFVQQNRLARARRRHDQSALALADRGHDVDDAHAEIAVFRLESKALVRIPRTQIVERNAVLRRLRILGVDALDFEQREVPLPRLRRAHLPPYLVSSPQSKPLDLRR